MALELVSTPADLLRPIVMTLTGTGAGGDGVAGGRGGRGGDVGSHNSSETSHGNSHNDNSVRQHTNGVKYQQFSWPLYLMKILN